MDRERRKVKRKGHVIDNANIFCAFTLMLRILCYVHPGASRGTLGHTNQLRFTIWLCVNPR